MVRRKINIGLIGLGTVADYQIKALKKTGLFNIVAGCDIDINKKNKLDRSIPFYLKYRDMMQHEEVEAIIISTPNSSHFEIAKDLVKKIPNILIEKPATTNLVEFEELIKRSIAFDCNLIVALHAIYTEELIWFLNNYESKLYSKLGEITSFRSTFHDPYIKNSQLIPNAISLDGSWMDSGINALSVIGKILIKNNLKVEDSHLIRSPNYNCAEIKGSIKMSFKVSEQKFGIGNIYTDWKSNLSTKTTTLFFGESNYEIILNHKTQQVIMVNQRGNKKLLADFSKNGARLDNHYINLITDFYNKIINRESNLKFAHKLHKLLFSAYN